MPAWLVILLLMIFLMLAINPSEAGYAWWRSLRRPAWMVGLNTWLPLLWLVIHAFLYVSAMASWTTLAAWEPRQRWLLIGAYGVLVVLIQAYTWLLCRTRRLDVGTVVGLVGWIYALVLALAMLPISYRSFLGLMPYLLWAPMEARATWQMRHLNP